MQHCCGHVASLLSLGLTTMLVVGPRAAETQEATGPSFVDSAERFDGLIVVETASGDEVPISVEISTWQVSNNAQIENPTTGSMALVELRSGEVTTVIDGVRVEREPGEIWVVAAEATAVFQTENDAAVLQVVRISRRQ